MFDISWSEFLVIGVVALIAIGPKELPGVLRAAGQWMGKIRRMAAEFQGQFQEAMREAEMADLKKEVDSIGDSARDLAASMSDATRIEDPTRPATPAPATDAVVPPPAASASETGAPATLPAPAEQQAAVSAPDAGPTAPADFNLPPPEVPAPVTEKDFAAAPAAPEPKAGQGGA